MIRYKVSPNIEALIEAECPGWIAGAKEKTELFRKAGCYKEDSGDWSRVKAVFMRIQHCKCAYCERKLADEKYGRIEHDVEHYRPKNGVDVWPAEFPTGEALPNGYFLLAYSPYNYLTSCKPCNSILKKNYFPIAGPRAAGTDDPEILAREEPYLIYPLGDSDTDPEQCVTFDGIVAIPNPTALHLKRRAEVIIGLFRLNEREDLWRERCEEIATLCFALQVLQSNPSPVNERCANDILQKLRKDSNRHANAIRCFFALWDSNKDKAESIKAGVFQYLRSES